MRKMYRLNENQDVLKSMIIYRKILLINGED